MPNQNKEVLTPDFCVIGGGAGGLSFAAGAVQMGASVVLLERHKMGGECLYVGCVPSKSLLAAAKAGHRILECKKFGWSAGNAEVDFHKVLQHLHSVIQTLEPHDSMERFQGLGVNVILEGGIFIDQETFETPQYKIKAKRFIVATGSSAAIPAIPGLSEVPYLTNDSLFSLKDLPQHLLIIGGGAIGVEMAQAFRRFGSQVTLLEAYHLLPRDDPELATMLKDNLVAEGINILENVQIDRVDKTTDGVKVAYFDKAGQTLEISATHLMIAAGRKANIQSLNLDGAHVQYTPKGIVVNKKMQTSNNRIYALGDCTGGYQFTHMAGYHAGIVLRNTIFKLRSKVQSNAVPWVIFTDPELSHVGYQEAELKEQGIAYKVLRSEFKDNDRAQTEGQGSGVIKVFASPKGYVLGVSILGCSAGELIYPWVIAIQNKLKLSAITSSICPYPTLSEINKRVAGSFYAEKLFAPRIQKLVRFLMRWTW